MDFVVAVLVCLLSGGNGDGHKPAGNGSAGTRVFGEDGGRASSGGRKGLAPFRQ